jgi:hypothetical protein
LVMEGFSIAIRPFLLVRPNSTHPGNRRARDDQNFHHGTLKIGKDNSKPAGASPPIAP